jgi:plastocyanin
MRRLVALAAFLAVLLVGCGGSSDDSDPVAGGSGGGADEHAGHNADGGAATCSPSGSALSVSAKDIKYDKACLAAPADKAFTIKFDNGDALPHNVTILKSHESTDAFFTGELLTGPGKSTTYNVSALPAGTYHFHCMIHPDQMNGMFIVA